VISIAGGVVQPGANGDGTLFTATVADGSG
jgi:hypothetical protein